MKHRTVLAVGVAWLAMWGSHGQEASPPTIESVGSATARVRPDYAEFVLTVRSTGDSFVAAARASESLRTDLRAAVGEMDTAPTSVDVSAVWAPDVNTPALATEIRLRFALLSFTDAKEQSADFAALCDQAVALGRTLGGALEGPRLGVVDVEAVERDVVARATENALYKAEAIAELMRTRIFAVQKIQVLNVDWEDAAGTGGSTILEVPCTARVRVVYEFAAP